MRSNSRYHVTTKKLTKIHSRRQKINLKPQGLWYAFGKGWVDYMNITKKIHIYQIGIHRKGIKFKEMR